MRFLNYQLSSISAVILRGCAMKIHLIFILFSFDIFGISRALEDLEESSTDDYIDTQVEHIATPKPASQQGPVQNETSILIPGVDGHYSVDSCSTTCSPQYVQCSASCHTSECQTSCIKQNTQCFNYCHTQQYNPCTSNCNTQCTTSCASPPCCVSCPTYCIQAPQICHPTCTPTQGPPQTVTVRVPVTVSKIIPDVTTVTVPKESTLIRQPKELTRKKICPHNYRSVMRHNEIEQCIDENIVSCLDGYQYINERCTKTVTVCANEYTKRYDICEPKIMCPPNYDEYGGECVPKTPQCQYGWNWNGRFCQAEHLTCPRGYTLQYDNTCVQEINKCPPNHKEYDDRCLKGEPTCPQGYTISRTTNICEQSEASCPSGTYEQQGQCVYVKQTCPAGSKDLGSHCLAEQKTTKTVYEM